MLTMSSRTDHLEVLKHRQGKALTIVVVACIHKQRTEEEPTDKQSYLWFYNTDKTVEERYNKKEDLGSIKRKEEHYLSFLLLLLMADG